VRAAPLNGRRWAALVERMGTERSFFEQLARILDRWTEGGVEACTNPRADLVWAEFPESFRAVAALLAAPEIRPHVEKVIRNILYGQLHSVLVMFDGGTELSDETNLTITDSSGREFPEGLHELFVAHLFDTNRIK
jgi:hypothetical protein